MKTYAERKAEILKELETLKDDDKQRKLELRYELAEIENLIDENKEFIKGAKAELAELKELRKAKRPISEAKKRANEKWDKANIRRFVLKVAKNTEKDILEKLEAQENVNGYIKRLIREDIERG